MATKIGTEASETINGTSSADTIHGKGGNDRLYGLAGADFLYGGLGNDILIGGGGRDTLTGGPGADVFKYLAFSNSRGTAVDLIKDFNGASDVVDLTALGTATLRSRYFDLFTGLQAVFTYDATTDTTTLSYYQGSFSPIFQLTFTGHVEYDEEAFLGISVDQPPTEGDDEIAGTANADTVALLGGNDRFNGLAGDDQVRGGQRQRPS